MGRNVLLAFIMIGLSIPIYFTMNMMVTTLNNPSLNRKETLTTGSDNWIFTVNTTIEKLNENSSILHLSSNVTFLDDVLMSQNIIGGFGIVIENTTTGFFWTPYHLYAPTLATEVNYHQVKGTTMNNYAITINKTGTKAVKDYVFNSNETAGYILKIITHESLTIFTGNLSINCATGLSISLDPSSWYAAGHFNQFSDSTSIDSTTANTSNTDSVDYSISLPFMIGFIAIGIARKCKQKN